MREGNRVVTLVVPSQVVRGAAELAIEVRDQAGNVLRWNRPLTIPSKARHKGGSK